MVEETELARRKALTFEQAEGMAELPRQLLRDEMPNTLRARLLSAVSASIREEMGATRRAFSLGPKWERGLQTFYAEHVGKVSANFDSTADIHLRVMETLFKERPALSLMGIVQALVRCVRISRFSASVGAALEQERSAYRLVDGDTLVPIGSEAEAETIKQAFADSTSFPGAARHLRNSTSNLSESNFAESIRESIHAVESVLRTLTGETSVDRALGELAKRRTFHPALKLGIKQLYGFSSDEPGIRHPLLDKGDAAVTEADAMLLLGICAALVTFLAREFGTSA